MGLPTLSTTQTRFQIQELSDEEDEPSPVLSIGQLDYDKNFLHQGIESLSEDEADELHLRA